MQLNLGSGNTHAPVAGWFTVDRFGWPVNVCADLLALPFKDSSVKHVHLSHVIEHVPMEKVPKVLSEIRRVLLPSGILYCSGPDIDRTEAIGSDEWTYLTRLGGPKIGWKHEWACGVVLLRDVLVKAGFTPTWCKSIPPGWPANTHAWPLDLEARFLCRRSDFVWPNSFPAAMQVQL